MRKMIFVQVSMEVQRLRAQLLTTTGSDAINALVVNRVLAEQAADEMDKARLLYKNPCLKNHAGVPHVFMLNGVRIEVSEYIPKHFIAVAGPDRQIITVIDLRENP